MKKTMLLLTGWVLLAGCDYTVPLVTKPDVAIDAGVVGLWKRGEAEKKELLLVLPFSEREYLVVFPAGSDDALYARGTAWRGESLSLVQLDWRGTARGAMPGADKRTFQYASYKVDGNSLTVRLINPEVIKKEIETTAALAQALADKATDPKLFREEMVFQKATP